MMMFFNLLTISLLALVAGLLLVVGQQVRVWRRAMAQSPLLAEQMAAQLLAARQGLESLRKGVIAQGPELSRMLSEGGKLRTELQFLLEKADQVAGRMDMNMDKMPARANGAKIMTTNGSAKNKLIEQVAGANGHAIQPSQPSTDPLEELLAGLQTQPGSSASAGTNGATPSTRRGPVTQAELNLAQRVNRGA